MIQAGTRVFITDNSGAVQGQVFKVLKGSKRRYARLGDVVVLSVKKAVPRKNIKKKAVVRGLVVRQRQPFRRADGSYIKFDDNAVVIIDKDGNPRGTRVFGPIPREISDQGYQKIASQAPEVL
jgi:large subunit ribosomal protein L14